MEDIVKISFLRIWQIIGDEKANPPIPAILPIGRTSFLNGVRDGIYPQPVRLGKRTTAWKTSEILALAESLSKAEYVPAKNIGKKKKVAA